MEVDAMRRLVAATAGKIKRGWAAYVSHLRDENPVEQIAARLHTGNPVAGLDAAIASYVAAQRNAFTSAAHVEARYAASPIGVQKKVLYFDDGDPGVLSWAERNKLDQVQDLTFEQRSLVRFALIEAESNHESPLETAKRIRDSIGLTVQQKAWVQSYRATLELGNYATALERDLSSGISDRVISSALARNATLTPAQIDAAVERYRANALTLRAETIARTESSRIAHQGSDELYRQALARGDLQADQLECEWLHAGHPSKKGYEREFHVAIDRQKRPWGVPFTTGLGNSLLFPCDPQAPAEETANCRCTRTVRVRTPAAARAA